MAVLRKADKPDYSLTKAYRQHSSTQSQRSYHPSYLKTLSIYLKPTTSSPLTTLEDTQEGQLQTSSCLPYIGLSKSEEKDLSYQAYSSKSPVPPPMQSSPTPYTTCTVVKSQWNTQNGPNDA